MAGPGEFPVWLLTGREMCSLQSLPLHPRPASQTPPSGRETSWTVEGRQRMFEELKTALQAAQSQRRAMCGPNVTQ